MKTLILLSALALTLPFPLAGSAQTVAATDAADAIDNLKRAALDKINSEVEINARAFADAQNIQASLVWSDWFRTAFDIGIGALDGLEAIPGGTALVKDSSAVRQYLHASITTIGTGKQAVSLWGGLDRLRQDGANLAIDIDGPAYSATVSTMLDQAYATSSIFYFDYPFYHDSVMNSLFGVVAQSSPLHVSHKSTALDRSGGGVFNSILDARSYISAQFSSLSTQLRQTQLPPDRIATMTSFINARRQDLLQSRVGPSHVSYDAYLSTGSAFTKRSVAYSLGTITLLEQWRGSVINEFILTAGFDQIGIFGRFVEASGSFVSKGIEDVTETFNLNLSVDAVIAGQPQANHILADASSLGFSLALPDIGTLADEQYHYESNSREQINMIPQQMMDSLPGEVSKLLLLVDDTVQYAQLTASAPVVTSTTPTTLVAQPLPSTQLLKVIGSGFTATSTLTFSDGVNPPYTDKHPTFISSSELDYNIAVGPNPATWTVTVVNNGIPSNPYTFYVVSAATQLTGLSISGPATVPENGSGQFTATAFFSDGTSQTVTSSSTWTENSPATAISSSGLLTAGSVSSDTTVTISASYTLNGTTKTTSANVVVRDSGTSSGTQTIHALVNGDFESGTSPWAPSGYAGILHGSYPHLGTWYAYLCNANNADGSFSQFFPIPAATTAATIQLYLNIVTEETAVFTAYDTMKVDLVTGNEQYVGTIFQFSNLDKGANVNGTYVLKSTNITSMISPYRGQSLYLVFSGHTDATSNTIFRIDDVDIALTVTNPVSLTGLSIRGPSSIPEGRGDTFWADAIFSDGTTQTISPNSWTEDSPVTTISSDGFLSAGSVTSDTPVTVTASYTFNSVTKQATKTVTIVDTNATRTLSYLSITGPWSINENSSGQFSTTAIFSDGSSQTVTPSWSQTSAAASISTSGLLTANEVSNDTTTTITATYTVGGVTKTASQSVSILNLPPPLTLSALTILGPVSLNENNSAQYSATALLSDGSSQTVTPVWNLVSPTATISSAGVLSAGAVATNTAVTILATYTYAGTSQNASKTVTVVNTNATPLCVLTVSASNGTVTADPAQATYAPGTQVLLTAVPDAGYAFAGWTGSTNAAANPLSLIIRTNMNLTANFVTAQPPPQLTALRFSDGFFYFTLNGQPGTNLLVLTSLDLASWTALWTNTIPKSGLLPLAHRAGTTTSHRFYRAVPANTNGTFATVLAEGLNGPTHMALDPNYIYFADNSSSDGIIKRTPKTGGPISTLVTGLTTPAGKLQAFTITGNALYGGYGADAAYNIFAAPAAGGPAVTLTTITGGAFIGTDGTVVYYSSDFFSINIMTTSGTSQTELAGGNWVGSSAMDDQAIYFVELGSKELRKFDFAQGTTTTLIGGNAVAGDVFIDATNVYLNLSGSIKRVAKTAGPSSTLVATGTARGYASDGTSLFFVDANTLKTIPVSGGTPTPLLYLPGDSPNSLVLDTNFIYWSDTSGGPGAAKILRMPKP